MSGKVVHISEDIHSSMMEFCRKNNIQAGPWVGNLIENAVSGIKYFVEKKEPEQQPKLEQQPLDEPVWSKPPYWINDK